MLISKEIQVCLRPGGHKDADGVVVAQREEDIMHNNIFLLGQRVSRVCIKPLCDCIWIC
jgi:hypothetical protein